MKNWLFILLYLLCVQLHAQQGCITGQRYPSPRYVCFDGRSLHTNSTGFFWLAKRGCFLSRQPCCVFEATHYGYYPNPYQLKAALATCKEGYPYHLGEMQTH